MENSKIMNDAELEAVVGGAEEGTPNGAKQSLLGCTVTLKKGAEYYADSYKGGNHGVWREDNPYVQSHGLGMTFKISIVATASKWQTAPYHLVDAANPANPLGWVAEAAFNK